MYLHISYSETRNKYIKFSDTSNPRYEYFGDGFSKGHCGIRIKDATFADSGKWKCKIGNETAYDVEVIKTVNVYGMIEI